MLNSFELNLFAQIQLSYLFNHPKRSGVWIRSKRYACMLFYTSIFQFDLLQTHFQKMFWPFDPVPGVEDVQKGSLFASIQYYASYPLIR